jgi:hypothetical protein
MPEASMLWGTRALTAGPPRRKKKGRSRRTGPKNRPKDIVRRCAVKRERTMRVVMMVDE